MLTRRYVNLFVTSMLNLGRVGVIKATNPNGTETSNTHTSEILSAAKTLKPEESGKTLFLGLAGGFAVTLPEPKLGLRYQFIVSVAPTTAYTIVSAGGVNNIRVVSNASDGSLSATGTTSDVITLVANQAVVGDRVNIISDGTNWFAEVNVKVTAGMTTAST